MKSLLFASVLLLPGVVDAQGLIRDGFSGVTSIQLSTGSGDAVILRGDGPDVGLVIEYTYSDAAFQPKIRQSGDVLILEEKIENGVMSARGQSTWTLTVPAGLDIRFSTGSGDIDITNIDATLRLSLGSGDVIMRDFRGEVRHASGSGDLDLRGFAGTLKTATGSGDISIGQSNGEIDAATGSGDVELGGHMGALKAATGSGDVSVDALVANGDVSLATGSGDIDVRLGADPKGDISMASGSGSSTLNLNGHSLSGELVMRTALNRGSIRAPFAFDSTEDIRSNGNRHRESRKRFGDSDQTVKISTGSGAAVIRE
jgi:DUF4097 and DUF4098 domain-containing protein YvlB